ncbi:MAG: exosortase/archaeosortase family protein [Terrimicrobiaceae bacterium]|nr:exosortase/archaeosortase family protein [Terrimicrobiaceae bacterium]
MTPESTRERQIELTVAGVCALAALWLLYAWNPYAYGYGSQMVTVLHFANVLWKGEDWQHCYLVPLAVAGMVWFERKSLPDAAFTRSWTGLAVTVFGLFVYWVGYRADNIFIAYASFQILIGGLILWLLGWKWANALFLPWAFLMFLYPLTFLDNLIAFPLRMVMSEASVHVLNLFGIGCIKSGTAILSAPDPMAGLRAGARFSVDVADPCSGIRSLFALMMVSALYGHFTQKGMWRKALLFLSSIPLAITGNLARIVMLTLGTIVMGPEVAIGTLEKPTFFHMMAGYVVFAVALAGMLGVGWLLNADFTPLRGRMSSPRTSEMSNDRRKRHQDEY